MTAAPPRRADGVICFGGEDWWYHNRGHFDMQLMRRFARRLPVLYVNSIGMRVPSPGEGRMFFTRIHRKVRSLRRGFVRADDNFALLSTPVMPGPMGLRLTSPWLKRSVLAAAARMNIRSPLLWIACPTAAAVVDRLPSAGVLYQRTDRYERFSGVDLSQIRAFDRWLKSRADLTVFCSSCLEAEEEADCRRTAFIDHGVDVDRFVRGGDAADVDPDDMRHIARPRVGFVGGIDRHTFDPELLLRTARKLPDVQFVLVGGCSLPAGWRLEPNVHLLGQKPYEQVAAYMGACDVLIMPWRRSSWIEGCNPVKLKEYLATGRPIVSTSFPELARYEDLVRTANDADDFAREIREALNEPFDPRPGRNFVRESGWGVRAEEAVRALAEAGVELRGWPASPPAKAQGQPPRRTAGSVRRPARRVPSKATRQSERSANSSREAASNGGTMAEGGSSSRHPSFVWRSWGNDVAACIMLAGGLRPSPLMRATGRSVLDLWITEEETVLDRWMRKLAEVREDSNGAWSLRIIHDAVLPPPWPPEVRPETVRIELEPTPLRGPAGLLRDVCLRYPNASHVLVVEAARAFAGSLGRLIERHLASGADATVAANSDGSPAGVYIIRCAALGVVPAIGFMDLKEQWLGRAQSAGFTMRIEKMRETMSHQLRDRRQFLAAAAALRDGASSRSIICRGAQVLPGAIVRESVVMPGAVVESGATVSRSLICPDTRVQAGRDLADSVITADVAFAGDCAQAGRLETAATE